MFLISENLFHPQVRHGFFTRNGGTSEGIYATLNCGPGSDDLRPRVTENRRRVAVELTGRELPLLTAYQVHSADCHVVTEPWPMGEGPQVDGLVTDRPGIILGALAADCAPVLFADPDAGVIGAAHAGWPGAFKGVVGTTVAAMESLGAKRKRIHAAVGPCIAQKSYQVGPEFYDRFVEASTDFARFFVSDGDGRWRFDLKAFVAFRLTEAGVESVNVLANDTLSEEDAFFSYRRNTLQGIQGYGRQISAICLME